MSESIRVAPSLDHHALQAALVDAERRLFEDLSPAITYLGIMEVQLKAADRVEVLGPT